MIFFFLNFFFFAIGKSHFQFTAVDKTVHDKDVFPFHILCWFWLGFRSDLSLYTRCLCPVVVGAGQKTLPDKQIFFFPLFKKKILEKILILGSEQEGFKSTGIDFIKKTTFFIFCYFFPVGISSNTRKLHNPNDCLTQNCNNSQLQQPLE